MKAITVQPHTPGSCGLDNIPEPDPCDGSVLVELARLLSRRERPEAFMNALHRQPEDIKVVIQFADA